MAVTPDLSKIYSRHMAETGESDIKDTIGFIAVIITVITTNIILNNSLQARMDDLEKVLKGVRIELGVTRSEICD